jgi:hypothetical protein
MDSRIPSLAVTGVLALALATSVVLQSRDLVRLREEREAARLALATDSSALLYARTIARGVTDSLATQLGGRAAIDSGVEHPVHRHLDRRQSPLVSSR